MQVRLAGGTVLVTESAQVHVDVAGVSLGISLPKSATAVLKQDRDAIRFDNGDGTTTFSYRYTGLDEIREASDGGLSMWKKGQQIGFFLKPWALDSNGLEVPTHYEVRGTTVSQVVEHDAADYAYPIVADPNTYLGSNSLYSATLNRDLSRQGVIIQVVPKPGINWSRMYRSNGLPPYYALVPSTYRANKYHDQLVCHWYNAGYFKVPWNLDSWRPDVGYVATVMASCNP